MKTPEDRTGSIPFVAFGNEELEKGPKIKKGDAVVCSLCKKRHFVKQGKNSETGKESDLLQFYKCGMTYYLVGVDGRRV